MNESQDDQTAISAAAAYGIEYAREKLAGLKLAVLTGAGLSTDSGIPDYRGAGKTHQHPMTFDRFMGSFEAQQRYWARSFVGWSRISQAQPNPGHFALALAEQHGTVATLITQNVDGLHQRAGSKNVMELHGRLDQVRCMKCGLLMPRSEVDYLLSQLNPGVSKDQNVEYSPDGDAEIEATKDFRIPVCPRCSGVLKPDVVFFGEQVEAGLVERCMAGVDAAGGLLVAGTSLSVNSGMRFVKRALKAEKPVVIINLGPTKGDELALAKIEANTSIALERLLLD
ncbi:MAG: NAD-dependent protein deacetylase [Micrococcales bacterium]